MSFRFRLIVTISLLIALTFGIGGSLLIVTSFRSDLDEERLAALDAFETAENTLLLLNSLNEKTDYNSLKQSLSQMESTGVAKWQAISLTGGENAIYQSEVEYLTDYQLSAPGAGQCSYMDVSDTYGYGIIVLAGIDAGDEYLELKARFDVSPVYADRSRQLQMFLIIYYVVVLIGVVTATALSFVMTGRLHKLTGAVRQIAGGDLNKRSSLSSQDEFGQLSRDIDIMADKLQENIVRLETDVQRQEAFMGAFAHELKTPMTSIIGYADLLRQDGLDYNKRQRAANYIFTEGQRLEKLSFKLLDLLLLKKDAPELKQVQLSIFLAEIENALAPALKEKGIRLVCKSDRGKAYLEPDLVKSLLYNLIDNAAKAMESSGIIAVQGQAINGGCQFTVIDNGRGMEKEELSKITDAFYRVDKARSRKQGGAGLGLALCKEIVALHRGSMRFASAPGTGTKVIVTLYGKEGADNA